MTCIAPTALPIRRTMAFVLLAMVHLVAGWGCTPVPPTDGATGAGAGHATERRLCVEVTNRFRATVNAAPLAASPALERYAAEAAAEDGRAHRAHRRFHRTRGGGIASAENVVPWWPLSNFESVAGVVIGGLGMMWDEGPRGDHRRNMEGPFREVGCGIFVDGDEVTVVQAFR
jgi:hypothetical protein